MRRFYSLPELTLPYKRHVNVSFDFSLFIDAENVFSVSFLFDVFHIEMPQNENVRCFNRNCVILFSREKKWARKTPHLVFEYACFPKKRSNDTETSAQDSFIRSKCASNKLRSLVFVLFGFDFSTHAMRTMNFIVL